MKDALEALNKKKLTEITLTELNTVDIDNLNAKDAYTLNYRGKELDLKARFERWGYTLGIMRKLTIVFHGKLTRLETGGGVQQML